MTLPVHYQAHPTDWPICGEKPTSYDSTVVWELVTCPACRERQTKYTLEHEILLPQNHPLAFEAHLCTVGLVEGVPVQLTGPAFLLALNRGECKWPERFQITKKNGDAHAEILTDNGWVAKDIVLPVQPFRLLGTGVLELAYYLPRQEPR